MDKNSALASFYNFLSVIFGILRKFGIEIGDPIFLGEKNIRRKKSEHFFVEFFLGQNNFDFWSKKCSLKISMKIQNFEISIFFRNIFKISKFSIFIEIFNEKIFDQQSKFFGPKKNSTKKFSDFFRRKKIR